MVEGLVTRTEVHEDEFVRWSVGPLGFPVQPLRTRHPEGRHATSFQDLQEPDPGTSLGPRQEVAPGAKNKRES